MFLMMRVCVKHGRREMTNQQRITIDGMCEDKLRQQSSSLSNNREKNIELIEYIDSKLASPSVESALVETSEPSDGMDG